jgi:GTP-binding protein
MDLVPEDIRDELCDEVIDRLNWQGKVFRISGQTGEGCELICEEIMEYLEANPTDKKPIDTSVDLED